jgi:hypothetical protein
MAHMTSEAQAVSVEVESTLGRSVLQTNKPLRSTVADSHQANSRCAASASAEQSQVCAAAQRCHPRQITCGSAMPIIAQSARPMPCMQPLPIAANRRSVRQTAWHAVPRLAP